MSIQVTPIPRLTVLTVPAFSLGTTNAAGSADTAVASNSTLLAFDATLPDAITYGQAGAVGAATVASRRDHAHAMADAPTAAVFGKVVRTGGNVTTTSTSLVDFTGAAITFTTGAFPVRYAVAQCGQNSHLSQQVRCNVDLDDGTLMHGTTGLFIQQELGGLVQDLSFSGQTAALSAAEHTLTYQWSVSANTGTILGTTANSHMFSAEEIT